MHRVRTGNNIYKDINDLLTKVDDHQSNLNFFVIRQVKKLRGRLLTIIIEIQRRMPLN